MKAIIKNFYENSRIFCYFGKVYKEYNEIKVIENEKLLAPNILNAYDCLKYQIVITTIVFQVVNSPTYSISKMFTNILTYIFFDSLMIIIFQKAKKFLIQSLKEGKMIKASNIYLCVNIYVVIFVVSNFQFCQESTEYDRAIIMSACIFWMIHSINLIPGNFIIKISSYITTVIILSLIVNPRKSEGIIILLAHVIAYIPQIYIIWKNIMMNAIF